MDTAGRISRMSCRVEQHSMPHTASINVLDFGRLFDSKCIGIYRCQIVSKLKVLFEQLSIQVSKNFAVSQMHYLSQTIELMRKICANYISDIQSICMQTSGEILTTDIKEGKQHNSGSLAVKKDKSSPQCACLIHFIRRPIADQLLTCK